MKKERTAMPQGAELCPGGVRYRIWAASKKVAVEIYAPDGSIARTVPLTADAMGFHQGLDPKGAANDLYKFRIDAGSFPDPFSRWQPDGVHGPSMVIEPAAFHWSDADWKAPALRDLVIYELHIGVFTPEGTFRAAIEKLPYLRELGITAIEIMPVADFPGERNWGYDGAALFAPSRAYGHPDDLRALVDAAHRTGLAVILDVVYNHFGPDGAYAGYFNPRYFTGRHKTPWGDAINFDGRDAGPVRAFFVANAIYWLEEFHLDGFRFDATHAIIDDSPRHIIEEITDAVHARGGLVICEDERNRAELITRKADGGYGADAVWADDFHHNLEVALTGDSIYRQDYDGSVAELADLLRHGWHYRGQKVNKHFGKKWGTECDHLPLERFVQCISNHDQAGNRAYGERLNHLVAPAAYRAVSALFCLTPYTPLLFMGQEWAASTPFYYFTNHHDELGRLVTQGRREEFKRVPEFRDPEKAGKIPDPQERGTFERSRLNWLELQEEPHAQTLLLYKELLALRAQNPALRPHARTEVEVRDTGILAIRYHAPGEHWLLLCDLAGGHQGLLWDEDFTRVRVGKKWEFAFSSNAPQFGGEGDASFDSENQTVALRQPETLLLRSR